MLKDNILDVAIVGGGVSGVYSAWRLMTSQTQKSERLEQMLSKRGEDRLKIAVFEGSHRIGGRLLSVTPPGMPNTRCELGGMRYMSSQKLVRSLVENKLKLETRPLYVSEPENIAYLRGQHLRLCQLTDPKLVPYALKSAEQGIDPSNFIGFALEQLMPGISKLHGEELRHFVRTHKFEGKHLYNWGFWNLLARSLSHEAYTLAFQAGGYDTTVLNWNAADTILLNCDFTPDVTYKAIVKGYEQIPLEICQQFVQAGGEVYVEHRLKSFAAAELPDGSSGVKMSLISQNQPGETIEIFARALILAMPRRSLELLDPTGDVLDPRNRKVQTLIRTVTPIPMFKMFVSYHTPWWEEAKVTKGRSVTDLPVRQCYYWGTEGEQLKADRQNQNSVLLASYDDTLNVTFWEGLRNKKEEPPFETKTGYYGSNYPGSPDWHHYKAPAAMVREIQRQLKEMHGLSEIPEPYSAAYMDWGDAPYGGGVNFWNIHAKSWEVIPQMVHPQENVPVYICGEAYSDAQGWVEGALSTAEIVLRDHFGLQPPDWVTEEV